ncbi:MAG TPA: hypothetical protein DDX39_00765 [Bacteroidales bacterium]|nr:MAG: hypothetical protein A2W98_08315 [Bacteroidetes bacterium GWF2_33_38]OFY76718.1 MAG: hypothetical protein A2265_02200 [Bacteroidetes bacterium RIFOXYA12_FULL_33_9]HBF87142.1 hypothetical protein [Bacteroidales bacterium]
MNTECNTENPCPLKVFFRKYKYAKHALGIIVGGIIGYLYYYYIGCSGGTCPITSNPWMTIGFGSLSGFILTK